METATVLKLMTSQCLRYFYFYSLLLQVTPDSFIFHPYNILIGIIFGQLASAALLFMNLHAGTREGTGLRLCLIF